LGAGALKGGWRVGNEVAGMPQFTEMFEVILSMIGGGMIA